MQKQGTPKSTPGKYYDDQGNEYREKKSAASCKIEEIQGITFGPISSRFWIYRKHINSVKNLEMPFYSWQCLTLNLKERSVDLVIPNDQDFDRLVKYLLYKMDSVDGNKDSGLKIFQLLSTAQNKD